MLPASPSPVVGERWRSNTLAQTFNVVSGPEAVNGLKAWVDQQFVGHRARRVGDGALALVNLTRKPFKYPYDFVLI